MIADDMMTFIKNDILVFGIGNNSGLFVVIFSQYMDRWNIPTQKSINNFRSENWKDWENRIEEVLTPIIINAAKEQGVK